MLPLSCSSKPIFSDQEEYLHYLKCQVLEETREFLCKTLEPDRYFPYLRSARILDLDMCEEIEDKSKRTARVSKLIDYIIKQGGMKGFDHLIEALKRKGTQGEWFVIRHLMMSFDDIKANPPAILIEDGEQSNNKFEKQISEEIVWPGPGEPGGPELPTLDSLNETDMKPKYT
ncbi:B-cell lymphoma/leukemia 10-like [Ptychodera flava]|uniref:B-cell lymphoma/leukemia 10-like n=1 Tax=Ptychodera flava TaxID=63121 RepID=UPI003969F8A1